MDSLEQNIKEFYKGRDKSHDWYHVKNVYHNAMVISGWFLLTEEELDIIRISCLSHDIWDSKYVKTDEKINEKKKMFCKLLNSYNYNNIIINNILDIVDTISFSKEKEFKNNNLSDKLVLLRNIVSDADKLESLGIHGIERMIDYNLNNCNSKNIKEDITDCYNNRILEIINNNYLKTDYGKHIGFVKFKEMESIILDSFILDQFIFNYIISNI